ncbi:MAG: T9SS type A sorting domain-containing protein [Bacteroidota bacterium]
MLRFTLNALCAFFLMASISTAQQDPMVVRPGEDAAAGQTAVPMLSKPDMRAQYFYDRVTYPGGSIPEGARVRAWREAEAELPMFAPRGKDAMQEVMEWKNMGPFNIGGRIITVAVNPKNANTILIGAAGGGIWRSYNAGSSWQSVSDDLPTQALGAIAIDPVDTNVVYAGTGEASYAQRTFDGGGMFKSTNGGTSWFEIGLGTLPPYARASDIVIDPSNTAVLYAAIPDGVRNADSIGIYRSRDAGMNWELLLTGRMSDIVINPQDPSILYTHSSAVFGGGTAQRYGMHKSTDGGDSWFKLDVGITDSLMGRTSIGICDAQPDVLYIGVSDITGNDVTPLLGIFKSNDAGATWTQLDVPFDYMASQGWYDNIMGVHPENPDIVYAGGVKVIFTTDGGASWTRMPDQAYGGIVHVDQHAIEFNRQDPSVVYLGNDGGFFVGSANGAMWEKKDYGLSITQFIGGAMHPSTDAVLFGGTQDNGTLMSTDAPDFTLALYGDGGNGIIHPTKPNIMYTTRETLKLYRSDDFGATWTKTQRGLGLDRSLFYIDYAMDPNDPDVMYLGTSKLYKSTNGGLDWSLKNSCLVPTSGGCYYVSSLSVAPYDGNIVMAGGTGGGVAISRDAGNNWSLVETAALPLGNCSSVRSFRPGILYATFSRYGIDKVWRSLDTGSTWASINADLPDIPVNDLIELDGKIIIGSDLGMFISVDEGGSWQRLGTGMPPISVQRLAYSARTGTLRAFTHGRGIYDLAWTQLTPQPPVFTSTPPQDTLTAGELFIYAAVVDGAPEARFRFQNAPLSARFDSVLGLLRWIATAPGTSFTIEARNSSGVATQTFTVPVRDAAAAEWEIVQPAPLSTAVNVMAWGPPEALWLGRDSAVVSRSTDGGLTWAHHTIPGKDAQVLDIHAFDGDRAIVGTRSGRILKTTDGGANWTVLLSTVNERYGNLYFHDELHGIAITPDPNNKRKAEVYRTADGGLTWSKNEEQLPARFPIDNTLTFFDENNGWFASSNTAGTDPSDATIFRTSDGGDSWIQVAVSAQNIAAISFADLQRGFCVDDMSGVVRRSVNGGGSWRAAFYPMGGNRNIDVQSFPGSDVVWIINDESAWISGDLGTTWKKTTLTPAGSLQDAVFADSLNGWVVSKAGIVQRLRANPLLSAGQIPVLPDGMRLDAAWPNPATASVVMLPFALSRSGMATIRVYNSAGVEIGVPFNGAISPGEHAVAFETAALPDGVYFYTLQTEAGIQSRRFVRMH